MGSEVPRIWSDFLGVWNRRLWKGCREWWTIIGWLAWTNCQYYSTKAGDLIATAGKLTLKSFNLNWSVQYYWWRSLFDCPTCHMQGDFRWLIDAYGGTDVPISIGKRSAWGSLTQEKQNMRRSIAYRFIYMRTIIYSIWGSWCVMEEAGRGRIQSFFLLYICQQQEVSDPRS